MTVIRYADAHRSRGICFNLQHIDFSTTSFNAACGFMQGHVSNILQQLDARKEIAEFTFGKTHTKSKNNLYFPINDTNSWNLSGIRSAWKRFKSAGFHNLVVVSVVDEHQIPLFNLLWPNNDTEDFTIALKQNLIHIYKVAKKDPRLGNDNFRQGTKKDNSHHGVLYIAIRYREPVQDDSQGWWCPLVFSVIVFFMWPQICITFIILYFIYTLYQTYQPNRK